MDQTVMDKGAKFVRGVLMIGGLLFVALLLIGSCSSSGDQKYKMSDEDVEEIESLAGERERSKHREKGYKP